MRGKIIIQSSCSYYINGISWKYFMWKTWQTNQEKERFEDEYLIRMLDMLLKGLAHLKNNGIYHSNIKSSNILMFQYDIYKLSDIGLHFYIATQRPKNQGTCQEYHVEWCPELFNIRR